MYIIHFICVFMPGKYKPILEMKCDARAIYLFIYLSDESAATLFTAQIFKNKITFTEKSNFGVSSNDARQGCNKVLKSGGAECSREARKFFFPPPHFFTFAPPKN